MHCSDAVDGGRGKLFEFEEGEEGEVAWLLGGVSIMNSSVFSKSICNLDEDDVGL